MKTVVVLDRMNRDDVGMVQSRDRAGLALEPFAPLGIGRKGGRQNLDGDFTAQARIARPVDFAHSARTDGADDFVRTESTAGAQRHRPRISYPPSLEPASKVMVGLLAGIFRIIGGTKGTRL